MNTLRHLKFMGLALAFLTAYFAAPTAMWADVEVCAGFSEFEEAPENTKFLPDGGGLCMAARGALSPLSVVLKSALVSPACLRLSSKSYRGPPRESH